VRDTDRTTVIRVQQLDHDGKVYRQFVYHVYRHDLQARLDRIALAYNLEATRVIVDGQEVSI
jgi:hypothetical protein